MSVFAGKRILILEDEPLVAMVLEDVLEDLGCVVVGPAFNLREAEVLVCEAPIDGAILDVNLGDCTSDPVAALLQTRGVRFVVASGYDDADPLPGACATLRKPYRPADVKTALAELFPNCGASSRDDRGEDIGGEDDQMDSTLEDSRPSGSEG